MPKQPDRPSFFARLRLLPLAERAFLVFALLCALAPPLFAAYSDLADPQAQTIPGFLGQHLAVAIGAALVLVALGLLALEPPHSFHPRSYLSQLAARWVRTTTHYDAGLRRLEESNERR